MMDKMKETILNFPSQFKEGLKRAGGVKAEGEFGNIVVCGVGGSALPADLLTVYLPDLTLAVYIHRSYDLPAQADQNSLVICISFSGNTGETISAFEEAQKRNFKVVAITKGGRLGQLAKKYHTPLVLLPQVEIQPRSATGYIFASLIKVLANCRIVEDKSKEISALAEDLKPAELENQGKSLAEKLIGKTPLCYASDRFKALARIWKIKFNENSKIMAFWNYFPELNHNELVGITNLQGKFRAVILQDRDDHPRILKRMALTADLFKKKGIGVDFIEIKGKNNLTKIFSALLLGDWTSYYLARNYKIDPFPVEMVEEFKKRLKE